MGPIGRGKCLRQPPLETKRGKQRRQFDHHDRKREPADRIGAIEAPGDEQEGQPRSQPQRKAEDIGPPALGERVQIVILLHAAFTRPRSTSRIAGVAVIPWNRIEIRITTPSAPHRRTGSSNWP